MPAGGKHFAPSSAVQQPASGTPRRTDQPPVGTRFSPQPAATPRPDAPSPAAAPSSADHASARPYSRKRARSYSKRAHSLGHRFFLGPGVTALVTGAAVFAGASAISGAIRIATEPSIASIATVRQRDVPTLREVSYTTVSFSAVGDNLMNLPVVEAADANAGEMYDGLYDFTPMYQGVADIVATHDLNFIDIETILGGDHLGLTGYPSFNSPAAIADEVADFGWNLATTATNHSLDVGIEGIDNSSATWAAHPEVVVTGTFVSPEDRARIRTVEKNGITFAFLSYTDYLNGIPVPSGYEYAVATADTDAMVADVTRAHELADVVIVAMSWGSENDFVPNETQRYFAQLLANLGVDLVVGFGPHVIQPIEWYQQLDAAGNPTGSQTLVVFSLGNFLSNQPYAYANVEGCFTCVFERLGQHGPITLTDLAWTPLINHIDGDYHEVFKLRDYTPELAWAHDNLSNEGVDPLEYAWGLTNDVIGPSGVAIR